MRKIPPLSAVRVFESAARHSNFTRAAAELGMTQAAVSYQMKVLEERLQTKLFLRQKGRLSLTEIGSRIAPLVSDGFNMLENAFSLALAKDGQVLTISTTQSFATNWLAPRIGSFQITEPQLAVRLRSDDHYVDFAAEDVDVAIRNGSGSWPGLNAHFLMRVVVQPFASPEFVARHGAIATPTDVMRMPRLSPDDWWWDLWLAQIGGSAGSERGLPGIRLDSQAMEANAAMAGHGIAIINSLLWQREIEDGRLVAVGPNALAEHSYWLTYPAYRRASPKIRAFRDWLDSQIVVAAASQPGLFFQQPNAA
jgi:LysR family transcriptional regulator, glycine cleavage system transcriptional activator